MTGIPLFFTADTHFNDHRTLDAGAYADRGRFELEGGRAAWSSRDVNTDFAICEDKIDL
ncbi:hypothetical protein NHF48_003310 [Sphingomonas sp. H160509]|uniref:hypothetical protein n=1 Tax=Sphingomonas sp. H160509 TaxID=2955313 RepID=UPI002096D761|nr:hypothetical protein [Sphingomonas sp. H160509]MDD1450222.1 hypothetical protein [Sphingomonas sp. H160509]